MTLPDRFWNKVDKNGPTPEHEPELGACWVWLGARTGARPEAGGGYGSFKIQGRARPTHILAYVDAKGPVPPDRPMLDHRCRNRRCCNPEHLEPVTIQTNTQRGAAGALARARTHCPQQHAYTPENTLRSPHGTRSCRECRRIRKARAKRRGRAA